jgi:hypothetical protein
MTSLGFQDGSISRRSKRETGSASLVLISQVSRSARQEPATSAATVALIFGVPAPLDARCSRKLRKSSDLAVPGVRGTVHQRPKK